MQKKKQKADLHKNNLNNENIWVSKLNLMKGSCRKKRNIMNKSQDKKKKILPLTILTPDFSFFL